MFRAIIGDGLSPTTNKHYEAILSGHIRLQYNSWPLKDHKSIFNAAISHFKGHRRALIQAFFYNNNNNTRFFHTYNSKDLLYIQEARKLRFKQIQRVARAIGCEGRVYSRHRLGQGITKLRFQNLDLSLDNICYAKTLREASVIVKEGYAIIGKRDLNDAEKALLRERVKAFKLELVEKPFMEIPVKEKVKVEKEKTPLRFCEFDATDRKLPAEKEIADPTSYLTLGYLRDGRLTLSPVHGHLDDMRIVAGLAKILGHRVVIPLRQSELTKLINMGVPSFYDVVLREAKKRAKKANEVQIAGISYIARETSRRSKDRRGSYIRDTIFKSIIIRQNRDIMEALLGVPKRLLSMSETWNFWNMAAALVEILPVSHQINADESKRNIGLCNSLRDHLKSLSNRCSVSYFRKTDETTLNDESFMDTVFKYAVDGNLPNDRHNDVNLAIIKALKNRYKST
jgi:hypothetical protein